MGLKVPVRTCPIPKFNIYQLKKYMFDQKCVLYTSVLTLKTDSNCLLIEDILKLK